MTTPQGLDVTDAHDARTVHLRPYLVELGRNDLRRVSFAMLGAALVWRWFPAVVVGETVWPVGLMLAVLIVIAGFAEVVLHAVHDAQRSGLALDVRLGRDDLRVTWRRGERVVSERRVFLRDVGRVDVVEAGYQRWHVLARIAGEAEPLELPAERESEEAAGWLAQALADAGRAARERDGRGAAEVPPELRRQLERS